MADDSEELLSDERELNKLREDLLAGGVKIYENFPKEGVRFVDIHPLLRNEELRMETLNFLSLHYLGRHITHVVGLESRGYYFGVLLAQRLEVPFVPIRKAGKLPGECVKQEYGLEYGKDVIEIQKDAIPTGAQVLIVDDLLATGGTAAAAVSLIHQLGAKVVEFHCLVELKDLKGREKLPENVPVFSILQL